jgi:oxygen-independent coproporphyrinogen-3 oxidase
MGRVFTNLKNSLGIYISIPFCRSKCTYCNFASGVYPASEHGRYMDRVLSDLRGAAAFASERGLQLPHCVDTIYLGGGTPTLLAGEHIAQLFQALRTEFEIAPNAEITVECAPGQLSDETLGAMAGAGVNRVSLGVQSFVDQEAAQSGRLHTRAIVLNEIERLRSAGIQNLNLDLIAGLAAQTHASWAESLNALIETGVNHASVYMLEVDDDSRLGRELLSGGVRYRAGFVPNEEAITKMYLHAEEVFRACGLQQYEISNFARAGAESQHNLRYWLRQPYLGVGVDASSFLYANSGKATEEFRALRWTQTDGLAEYLNQAAIAEETVVSKRQEFEEEWFLGLRLNSGVNPQQFFGRYPESWIHDALEIAGPMLESGWLEVFGERIRLTSEGRLCSNEVFAEFLES